MTRGGSKISRDTDFSNFEVKAPSWADDYLSAVHKYSVKTKSQDGAIFDQISNILNGTKSKYSSVEEAVLDMQKRTGLLEMLQKTASTDIELFKVNPEMKTFIDNHIKDYPGSSVDSVVFNLMRIPAFKAALPSGDDVDEDVKQYINGKIKQLDPSVNPHSGAAGMDLGKADVEMTAETDRNNNPLNALNPAVY